jgi:hypothetical protein
MTTFTITQYKRRQSSRDKKSYCTFRTVLSQPNSIDKLARLFYAIYYIFIIYLVLNIGNLHIYYWKNITTAFVCRDWYRYHHPFIIPLKMILITWLKVHNTQQDFLMFKYMINIIWYGSFRMTSRINPRPISSLEFLPVFDLISHFYQ